MPRSLLLSTKQRPNLTHPNFLYGDWKDTYGQPNMSCIDVKSSLYMEIYYCHKLYSIRADLILPEIIPSHVDQKKLEDTFMEKAGL